MSVLRVVLDPIVAAGASGLGRYAVELTRALIDAAPRGATITGIISASPESDYALIEERLPGLDGLYKSALARRELQAAWQHGFTRLPGEGMIHATSLLAPLYRHDRVHTRGEQIAVTMHDTLAWTHPETLTPRTVAWHKAMAKRAERYADAVVVPSHTVAAELSGLLSLGERIRVIGGAVAASLGERADAEARAVRLDLPERYLVFVGAPDPHKGIEPLLRALASELTQDVPLLIVGPESTASGAVDVDAVSADAGLAPDRVRRLGVLDDGDLAVVLSRATAAIVPSLAEGFGLGLLEAFSAGTPVVHSDAPALLEIADGAGLVVERGDQAGYPERLADAIGAVLEEPLLAERLGVKGRDRARLFTWRDSAEKVWQLHADL